MSYLHCLLEHLLSILQITQTNQATDTTYSKRVNITFRWSWITFRFVNTHDSISFLRRVHCRIFLAFIVNRSPPTELSVGLVCCVVYVPVWVVLLFDNFSADISPTIERVSRSIGHDCRICRRLHLTHTFPVQFVFIWDSSCFQTCALLPSPPPPPPPLLLPFSSSSSTTFLVFLAFEPADADVVIPESWTFCKQKKTNKMKAKRQTCGLKNCS